MELAYGERVLDIGCGTGQAMMVLADTVGPTDSVQGLDRSAGMLQGAADRLGSCRRRIVSLTMGNASALCFRSNVFDAVFMTSRSNRSVRGFRPCSKKGGAS
jgi:demethylmenaquinone methyltransferase/2-methoxy-6-polyprenyl-1,4-benzoquinol methylase